MRTLRNDQWHKIRDFLMRCPEVYLGTEADSRRFIDAVLWITRTGAPWRDLPDRYGNWNTVYKRFARWCDQGIWEQMFAHFADDPDMENLILDSTVVRAHPCAAGAAKKNSGQLEQALGRSHGGFSTKTHVSVDGLGYPLPALGSGQAGDSPQAAALLDDLDTEAVIADRAYDTNALREQLADQGVKVVIPPHSNRKEPADYDRHRYKERHLVECFINKIKHYRRVFSRFEKLVGRYLGFVQFASALI